MSTERKVILLPVEDPRGKDMAVRGSQVITAGCGHRTYISPASIKFLAEYPDAVTQCLACLPPTAGTKMAFVPGSRAELEAAVGVGQTDQLRAWAKALGINDNP